MRHFLRLPAPPGLLPGGMPPGSALGPLVACPGPSQGLPALNPSATGRAIHISVVTPPADPDLSPATLAQEKPVTVLDHRDPDHRGTGQPARIAA